MKKWIVVVFVLFSGVLFGAPITQEEALSQAFRWMESNPVMSKAGQTVTSIETFPNLGTYSVYVVHLEPSGYLVLNSDDRFPLLVSFSADSLIDLSDDPNNAFRAMLLDYCERAAEELLQPVRPLAKPMSTKDGASELYGPFLETSWNQNDPYNLFCPDDPGGSSYYGYRVPTGCVPTAFAQVLAFHRWPVHGTGSRSYTDSSGTITGPHSADFSDSYDWGNMKAAHSPSDPLSEQEAVAELMYELGVAAEANYESSGTSSSVQTLGNRLQDYFFFEPISYMSSLSSLISPLEADLRAGFPCVVSIPNHAIVADGLMVDGGSTNYHINYGWGGSNNGWFTASGIPGGSLQSGAASIRPQLMAFPESASVSSTNGAAELKWILPKRLEDAVTTLTIKQYVSGIWELFHEDTTLSSRRFSAITTEWDGCDDFSVFELTTTDPVYTADWAVTNFSGVGNCFYKTVPEYGNCVYHLTSRGSITPAGSTRLLLNAKYSLFSDVFRILVSTDRSSFVEIWSAQGQADWSDIAIDLSAYAGQNIYVRLQYDGGSYYTGGGIWIDSISTQEVTNPELEGQPVYYTTLSNLTAGTYTLAAVLTDTNAVEHALGPSFELSVSGSETDTDHDGLPNNWEQQYFGGPTNAVAGADSDGDGFSNLQEYISGFNPTNSASFFYLNLLETPAEGDGFVLEWSSVTGRVYAVNWTTNLPGGFQSLETNIVWPQASYTDTLHNAESEGFYQINVELAP